MKGSFTGAHEDRAGKFELAHGGTLFLDEIGDMSPNAQAKVLRALQEGVVTRVGGARPIQVDVRVLSATNKDLAEEIRGARFREDLFYRLNVIPLHLPPLRERREDIAMLVQHFAERAVRDGMLRPRRFSTEALERLQRMDWPGNVRELRNTVERLLILASGDTISAADVDLLVAGKPQGGSLSSDLLSSTTFAEFKDAAERAFILQKLRENDWNVAETARLLDMPRSNLYKKIERYALVREE
jgi:two-component system nitrogen regulation response regulator NtrX